LLPSLQLWTLPLDPLQHQYCYQLLDLVPKKTSISAGAAARLLDLGIVPALQQRLRVFGRTPLPGPTQRCATSPPPANGSSVGSKQGVAKVDILCMSLAHTVNAVADLLAACYEMPEHEGTALQAVRQLLSDRFSLAAVVEKGLAPALVQAAPSSAVASACIKHVKSFFIYVAHVLFQHDTLQPCHRALAMRLQQQLTTFLNLDAIRPHLQTLCVPPPGSTCPPTTALHQCAPSLHSCTSVHSYYYVTLCATRQH
jgi:hypothetical protein